MGGEFTQSNQNGINHNGSDHRPMTFESMPRAPCPVPLCAPLSPSDEAGPGNALALAFALATAALSSAALPGRPRHPVDGCKIQKSHHLRNLGKLCPLAFRGESAFQDFSGGAGFRLIDSVCSIAAKSKLQIGSVQSFQIA